jgi:hypothetical protein
MRAKQRPDAQVSWGSAQAALFTHFMFKKLEVIWSGSGLSSLLLPARAEADIRLRLVGEARGAAGGGRAGWCTGGPGEGGQARRRRPSS